MTKPPPEQSSYRFRKRDERKARIEKPRVDKPRPPAPKRPDKPIRDRDEKP